MIYLTAKAKTGPYHKLVLKCSFNKLYFGQICKNNKSIGDSIFLWYDKTAAILATYFLKFEVLDQVNMVQQDFSKPIFNHFNIAILYYRYGSFYYAKIDLRFQSFLHKGEFL